MDTAFTRLVGCRAPIQQAGMGATSWVELAAAVADAGALGMLGTAGVPEGLVLAALDALAAGVWVALHNDRGLVEDRQGVGAGEDAQQAYAELLLGQTGDVRGRNRAIAQLSAFSRASRRSGSRSCQPLVSCHHGLKSSKCRRRSKSLI